MTASAPLGAAVALAVSLAMMSSAQADTTATSTITSIKVIESFDKNYSLFNGAIWLNYDKSDYNYRWGGKHCKNHGLSDMNVSLLFAAFRSKFSITIDYKLSRYKKRTYRCISGFLVTRS